MSDNEDVKVGDVVRVFETQGLELKAVVSKVDEEGFWAELKLGSGDEEQAWEADPVSSNFDVFAFGIWFDGDGLPVWWGDLDGDGKPELLAPIPKGDLSATIFRIFRWTGDSFLFLKKRALVGNGNGGFEWTPIEESFEAQHWIESFENGKAVVVSLTEDEEVDFETLELAPNKKGFEYKKG